MIESTTVTRMVPSVASWWLRRRPSCYAPSRAMAARDCWFSQSVQMVAGQRLQGDQRAGQGERGEEGHEHTVGALASLGRTGPARPMCGRINAAALGV